MEATDLSAAGREHLAKAAEGRGGRSATTLVGGRGHVLGQTLVAFRAGEQMKEHDNPGEATLQVLQGTVRLVTVHEALEMSAGQYAVVPQGRHSLEATTDAVVLLTTVH